MRDRMIEVIQDAVGGCDRYWAELIADALIKHGGIMPPRASATEYQLITVNAEIAYVPPLDLVGLGADQMLERDCRRAMIDEMQDALGIALTLKRRDEPFGRMVIRGEIIVAVPEESMGGKR